MLIIVSWTYLPSFSYYCLSFVSFYRNNNLLFLCQTYYWVFVQIETVIKSIKYHGHELL